MILMLGCQNQTSKVTFEVDNGHAILLVDDEIWESKAISGFDFLDMAETAGVNTIRTWGLNNLNEGELLDEAQRRGMKVLVGLWLAHQNHGIDYTLPADSLKIQKQYDRITQGVLKYKDHPAILAWGVGNEVNAKKAPQEVWHAVNDIAAFIHNNDPNHPTSTILAGSSIAHIKNVMHLAPEVDILSINSYLDTKEVRSNVAQAGWKNPFMVTELGPDGFWESDTTLWGAPIEVSSKVAAQMYVDRYRDVDADPLCIGVFPFKWGSVPKKTPTWLSIFLADSCKTQAYDELYYIWNNHYPSNRAPLVNSLKINDKLAFESVYLKAGDQAKSSVEALDLDGDGLQFRWEILPEIDLKPGIQGTQDIIVKPIDGFFASEKNRNITFRVPEQEGAYRLYVYVNDNNHSCGYANIPFYVIK